ncbi:MAG: prepilin-type N-terminal cleavage/methylation domain-containing protein [Phycisphaeraceae bacterium]|nr:prepilin-type N-terminal cleavage/methylation domain-containing protein [Phycisphaeraceae bacterium]MBX3367372.1 prepilin-type N-terminal cleavage/methylation domain-containing protein [Phycisphaeraceae bacterium]
MIRTHRDARSSRAFTLIEVALATAIIAIVGATVSSVIMVAARSSPRSDSGSATAVAVADLMAQMALDISHAREILALNEGFISVVSTDLDGDTVADEIAYAFDENDGGSLLRLAAGTLSVAYSGILDAEFDEIASQISDNGQSIEIVRSITFTMRTADGVHHRRTFRCLALPLAP